MKHATVETLNSLRSLLDQLRKFEQLVERTPGCFYLGPKAYLHFHEDPLGTYVDVKLDLAKFTRLRVTSAKEQSRLLQSVRQCLGSLPVTQRKRANTA